MTKKILYGALFAVFAIALVIAPALAAPKKSAKLRARAVRRFVSCADLRAKISKLPLGNMGYGIGMRALGMEMAPMASAPASDSNFSKTNVQVEGVDEGDIVKTDGKYIYNLSQGNLIISSAVPADSAKLLSKTKLEGLNSAAEIYIEGDYLLVLGSAHGYSIMKDAAKMMARPQIYPYPYYNNYVSAQIWDISNKEKPALKRNLEYSGNLLTSRMTNGYAYLVINSQPQYHILPMAASDAAASGVKAGLSAAISRRAVDLMPVERDRRGAKADEPSAVAFKQMASCASVEYIYPIRRADYLQIVSLDMKRPMSDPGEKIILGAGDKVYASAQNLYVAGVNSDYNWFAPKKEQTEIQKFKLDKKSVELAASQNVPGTILNQFSMDEFEGNLRLVTTLNGYWGEEGVYGKKNSLYVLDKDLNRVGSYASFGEGEKIYSARFMGKRAYVVTFQETDPLFVFDLADARNPKLLGELKIPGYSTYLHPYDDTHLIGIGKNAVSNTDSPGFAWYQGLKLGLFDVTDPNNPKEMFKTEIGDRGTDSAALTDHHAFLFSKDKNLLAFPVTLAQLSPEQKADMANNPWAYGTVNFQGLFVYKVDLENGFQFKGPVTHIAPAPQKEYVNYYGSAAIKRSLYIGDNLYALSDYEMTAHKLSDLSQLSEVIYGTRDPIYYPMPMMEGDATGVMVR
ncbi:hypothetical protein EPN28_03785 [Patescibacteria group bacterium]|nr:MAG: hypothetical protein EPN28_03785 [Patescibacteria group bacterium]